MVAFSSLSLPNIVKYESHARSFKRISNSSINIHGGLGGLKFFRIIFKVQSIPNLVVSCSVDYHCYLGSYRDIIHLNKGKQVGRYHGLSILHLLKMISENNFD